jgi:hypothetical protein
VLTIGSQDTCGARFVKHFGIGETVPYDRVALEKAMDRICDPNVRERMRSNAARLGEAFSDRGVGDWLARSLQLCRSADARFEDAFAGYDG